MIAICEALLSGVLLVSDAELCKDRREPARWFHVPRRMEGPRQVLRELASRRGITTASSFICLANLKLEEPQDFSFIVRMKSVGSGYLKHHLKARL